MTRTLELRATDFYDDEDGHIFVYIDTSDSDIDMLADRNDGELSCAKLNLFTIVGLPHWRLMQHLAFQLKKEFNRNPAAGGGHG